VDDLKGTDEKFTGWTLVDFAKKKTWLARKKARYNSCKMLFFYTCSASKMLDL
jgi:hypothetical protein